MKQNHRNIYMKNKKFKVLETKKNKVGKVFAHREGL